MQRLLTATESFSTEAPQQQRANHDGWTVWRHVMIVLLFVAAYITVAYYAGGERDPDHYFGEGRAIDVMSALFLVMAGSFAWGCFLLRRRPVAGRHIFWMLLALGFIFVALDEMLEFHESFDEWLRDTWVGWPPLFRNWNDVVVISYGIAGVALLVKFWREIARLPRAAPLLGLGGFFYVLHTGIDSLMSNSVTKNLIEESAKLTASAFFALAMLAAFIALIWSIKREGILAANTVTRTVLTESEADFANDDFSDAGLPEADLPEADLPETATRC